MTDELHQPVYEPQITDPSSIPQAVPLPPKKSRKTLWFISGGVAGVVVVVAGICLVMIACAALIIAFGFNTASAKAPVEVVLDRFLKYMVDRDIENAYALFSPRAQRQVTKADLEKLVTGNNYLLFEGYQSLTVDQINIQAAAHTNPDMPQGTVAQISGTVSYQGGITGQITAVLEKVDEEWMLHRFNLIAPPDKFLP